MNNDKRDEAYDLIDRFLRNNMDDMDYADYSQALDLIYGAHLQHLPLTGREGEEALQSLDAMVPAHLRSSRHGENFMGKHYDIVRAALLRAPSTDKEGGREGGAAGVDLPDGAKNG